MTSLPSGTVTFLFTDIEGSTQLWEKQPDAMKRALARHDTLLRGIFEAHRGHIFKTMGDAFLVAFESPAEALNAAIDAQHALQKEAWGEAIIKVRMALHCGEVETRDNDYFGQPLNRVARLLSAGHGGQVLLSTAIKEEVATTLPADISLRDMGERRLKDLIRPEHIYQLLAPNLPADFPPLKTLDTFRTHLPIQLTSFIGREKEISEVKKLVGANRLVTLTGVGGTGKTRLSLQVASTLVDDFSGGVWFIELASVANPELVLQTITTTLQLQELAGHTPQATLTEFLETRTVLLILDNCEHLLQPCAQLAAHLLQACPQLKLIITSREPLGIAGEIIWSVPSFSVPQANGVFTPAVLEQFDSVRLFIERARAVQPGFDLNEQNARAIVQICNRLDGIPLALELAAARVRGLSVDQIATRLDSRFRLLTGGSRSALPRQQTIGALIDWSYNLLSDAERLLFQRLAVFIGPFNLESAEKVCSGDSIEEFDVFDLLQRLVDKSLVVIEKRYGDNYYRLLETIRQYGRDKLLDSEKAEDLANRHAEYYEVLAGIAFEKLHGPYQLEWLRKLGVMHDNLRTALGWVIDIGETKRILKFVQSLSIFWFRRSELQESRQWFERVLALPNVANHPTDYILALAYHARGTWLHLGSSRAKPLVMKALSLARERDEKIPLAEVLLIQCLIAATEGDFDQGVVVGAEAKILFQELNDEWGCAHAVLALALCSSYMQNHTEALSLYREALGLFEKQGDIFFQNVAQRWIGVHEIGLGNYEFGMNAMRRSLKTARLLESNNEIAHNLWAMADIELGVGKYTRAIRLYFATKHVWDNLRSWDEADEKTLQNKLLEARNVLGEFTFTTVCEQGDSMTLEQAIEYALEVNHE